MALRFDAKAEPIPGYRLIERLGRGGFGEVWKAEAPGGILKAIKLVYGNLDEASGNGKPAEQELKALHRVKSIRHPYILTLERFDIVDGQLLIVMELADRNLYNRFRECQNKGLLGIPREELLGYMEEAAEALDLMNNHYQIQHLDIKPQNLFLIFNHIKIADFGLAKDMEGKQATLTGGVTPVYAAPETFEGQVTRYCDQYSLAIVYQEMLTGERPFPGTSARQLMLQHLQSPPDLSSLAPAEQKVVERALAKTPEDRHASCMDFVQALRSAGKKGAAASSSADAPVTIPATTAPKASASAPTPTQSPVPDSSKLLGMKLRPSASNLPPLTEGTRLPPLTLVRPNAQAAAAASAAKTAPPEQTGDGTLMPILFVGLGELGLALLHLMRRAIKARYRKPTLPHLRFFGIDTDPKTIQSIDPASPTSLEARELYLARLNRPSHYTKYQGDPTGLDGWLAPQLLYRIPRNPATDGIRAFGRLAFFDHYRPLMQRIRAEIESCIEPDTLSEADDITQLGLRTNRPRVYIISSLTGGTGSGMFLDVAYSVRHQLRQLGYTHPDVHALLFAPTVDRAVLSGRAVANAYAALTELAHFSLPQSCYEATFDPKEGPIVDRDRPFSRCMVLQLPKTADIPSLRPIVNQATGYLFRETLTNLGRNIDKVRSESTIPAGATHPFHTFGTYRLTWPRDVLLERTTRRSAERLVRTWIGREAEQYSEAIHGWLDEQWTRRNFHAEALLAQLTEACHQGLEDEPYAVIEAYLAPLEDQVRASQLKTADVCTVLDQILHLVGQPELEGMPSIEGRLAHIIERAVKTHGSQGEGKIAEMAVSFMETPGHRLPAAEEVVRQLLERFRLAMESHEIRVPALLRETADLYTKMLAQMGGLDQTKRGSRKVSLTHEILNLLRLYARKRLELLLWQGVVGQYRGLTSFAPEYLREVQFCRQRLEGMLGLFADKSPADIESFLGPSKAILPPGCKTIDAAAEQLASILSPQEMHELDAQVQAQIRKQYNSLSAFSLDKNDQSPAMAELILGQTRSLLEPSFRETNSAAVYFQNPDAEQAAHRDLMIAFEDSVPDLSGPRLRPENTLCLISVPEGEAGHRFVEIAEDTLGGERVYTVTGSEDIVIYREHAFTTVDLPQLGPLARDTFTQISQADSMTTHARGDVHWQPAGRD